MKLSMGAATALVASSVLLSGCAPDPGDIKADLDALEGQARSKIAPLPEPMLVKPFAYENAALRDPFTAAGGDAPASPPGSGLVPDVKRPKEHLESYPLDSIRMVGSLARGGRITAIVMVDGTLYQVAPGSHLGLDFGRVTKVTGDGIEIREVVQDANNVWAERTAMLKLEENEGKK